MVAGRLDHLCEFYNAPGFCDERLVLYLARDLEQGTLAAQGIEEQHMTVERVRLTDLPQLVAAGLLMDAKTLVGLAMARDRLAEEAVNR